MNNQIALAAHAYRDGGVSVIPINAQKKRPYASLLPQDTNQKGEPLFWKKEGDHFKATTEETNIRKGTWHPYQSRIATQGEVDAWISRGVESVAGIGGVVSGGLEFLDFDSLLFFDMFMWEAKDIVSGFPMQMTGSGKGAMIAYRCPDGVEGNQKLAWMPDKEAVSGREIAIETRGEGGYALLPPSRHPSGGTYRLMGGRFSDIPTIEKSTRNALLDVARSLCLAPKSLQQLRNEELRNYERKEGFAEFTGDSVIGAYNARKPIEEVLIDAGYTHLHGDRWSRPGKESSGGVTVFRRDNKSFHFSSNDAMDSERDGKAHARTPFDFLLEVTHRGDMRAAVRAAAEFCGMSYRQLRTERKPIGKVYYNPVDDSVEFEPDEFFDEESDFANIESVRRTIDFMRMAKVK